MKLFAPRVLVAMSFLLGNVSARALSPETPRISLRDDTFDPTLSVSGRPFCSKSTCANPRKGDVEVSCHNKHGLRSLSPGLFSRDFKPLAKNGDAETLSGQDGNTDMSTFERRNSGFIPFDGKTARTGTVVGLIGCTVIAAMSDKGMMIAHVFESGEDENGNPDLEDTLHPQFYKATLDKVGKDFAAHKNDFSGGQLLIMVPVHPDHTDQYLYDVEKYQVFDNGKFTRKRQSVQGIVDYIQSIAAKGTGLTPKIYKYTPPKDMAEDEALEKSQDPRGTFAIQYDPRNSNTKTPNARQIWCENKAQYNPQINFAISQ